MAVNWVPSADQERFMEEIGITWELVEAPISAFDLVLSRHNKARPVEPKLPDVVAGLREDMDAGYPIPRIITYRSPTGYAIADGNQRIYAFEERIADGIEQPNAVIGMYLMTGEDRVARDYATLFANCRHGGRNPTEEKILLAMRAVKEMGETVKRASRLAGISESTLRDRLVAEEEYKKLCRAGHKATADVLKPAVLVQLRKVNQNDHAREALAGIAAQHNLPAVAVSELAARVKKAGSDRDRLKILADERERLIGIANGRTTKTRTTSKVPTRGYRDRILRLSGALLHFLNSGRGGEAFRSLDDFGVSVSDRKATANQLKELLRILSCITKKE